MSINTYVADELANKVVYLSKALAEAQDRISALETKNQYLQDALISLTSINNQDYIIMTDNYCEQTVGSGL